VASADERDRIEAAHRAWYLALAEAADRDVDPAVAAEWPADCLELEHDDVRTALASAIRRDPPAALRLAGAVWWWWMARGYFVEGARWLEAALDAAPEPTRERARALVALGGIEVRRSRPGPVVALGNAALEIVRRGGDRVAEARALERLAVLALGGYEWEVADAALGAGLALATEVGDAAVVAGIKQAEAVRLGCVGENARARAVLEEALALLAEIPDEHGPVFWAAHISPVVLPVGRAGALRCFFEDTYCLFRAVRSSAGIGYALCNIAETWRAEGDHAPARDALDRALDQFRALGDEQGAGVALNALGSLARSTGEYDAGRAWFDEALALRRAAHDTREMAMTLMGIGMLALHAGERDEGRRLIDEAHDIYVRIDDGPGIQGVPLNLGAFELDHGDPERACALLDRCIEVCRTQGMSRHRGWASAELAEGAIALGDGDRARVAMSEALVLFEAAGDRRGVRCIDRLRERVDALAPAD
jgi:tetratricopeptide (TPR) repeat protein